MEGGKQSGSSLASDLFGAKDSSAAAASSTGIFNSMFPPPPKVIQRGSYQYSETEKKTTSENSWTAKNGVIERVKGKTRAREARKTLHIIIRKICRHSITAPPYTMVVKNFILGPRVLRILGLLSTKMQERTTPTVLQEGTGGRDPFTIRT